MASIFKINKITSSTAYEPENTQIKPQYGYIDRLKQERGRFNKRKKLIDNLGKPLKAKEAPIFSKTKKRNSGDRKWLLLIFLFVVFLGTLIFFTAIKRDDDKYRRSIYYVNLNNHLYDVQEETRVDIGMQAAVLINFRERILLLNET